MNSLGIHINGSIDNICDLMETLNNVHVFQFFVEKKDEILKKFITDQNIICIVHASYTINLARDWNEYSPWIYQFIKEIEIADYIGAKHIVVHFGKQMNLSLQQAYNNMFSCLSYINSKIGDTDVNILLETSSGQGSELCYKLEDLAYFYKKIINHPKLSKRIGLCLDTCHVFAAGYNLQSISDIKKYFQDFDNLIGLNHIKVIHLNDSKKELGSNVDRHENINKGYIGKTGLLIIADFFLKKNIPIILETPYPGIVDDVRLIIQRKNIMPIVFS